jgi:hypothetical protein
VALFKDYLIYDNSKEHLKRYYRLKDSIRIFKKLSIKSIPVYPNYCALDNKSLLFKNIKRKQKGDWLEGVKEKRKFSNLLDDISKDSNLFEIVDNFFDDSHLQIESLAGKAKICPVQNPDTAKLSKLMRCATPQGYYVKNETPMLVACKSKPSVIAKSANMQSASQIPTQPKGDFEEMPTMKLLAGKRTKTALGNPKPKHKLMTPNIKLTTKDDGKLFKDLSARSNKVLQKVLSCRKIQL